MGFARSRKVIFLPVLLVLIFFTSPAGIRANAASNPQEGAAVKGPAVAVNPIKGKEHIIKTEDKWEISLNRYVLKGKDPKECKAAVILCHGFNFSNLFWDLDKRVSLARYLARNGYDVWAPSLRGSGYSSKPVLNDIRSVITLDIKDIPRRIAQAPSNLTKLNWTIDDHIYKDAPAIINYVKKKTGFDKVYWIGHSMGGIIMFGYLETHGQDDIAGFIPIGSMMIIPKPLTPHLKRIAEQEPLLKASLIINTRTAAQLRSYTLGAVKYPIEELLLKRENMDEGIIYRLFRDCISDTSAGVVSQFADSIREGNILSADKKYNYTARMDEIHVPVLILGGGDDAFVSREGLLECYEALSSRDKSIVICSKDTGYSADYGHCDLLLGKKSAEEVYPAILDWLDERAEEKGLMDWIRELFM